MMYDDDDDDELDRHQINLISVRFVMGNTKSVEGRLEPRHIQAMLIRNLELFIVLCHS